MGITIVDLKTGAKKKKVPPKPAKGRTQVTNPSTSDVHQKHKRKGGGSEPHPSRGRINTATIKKNVDAAARRANKRSEKAMRKDNNILTELGGYLNPTLTTSISALKAAKPKPRPKRKPSVPKVPTITGPKAEPARRPTMKEQREAGNAVLIDYDQLENLSQKAGGGKVNYRMSGGQVVANCYD